jgi:predicted nucleic acid-binding protein
VTPLLASSYIDANYWIYWFDERLPEHDLVNSAMQSAIENGVVVSTVTLMEVAHYFRDLAPKILNEKMKTILSLSTMTIKDFTSNILQSSISYLSTYSRSGLGSRDCVIIATMKEAGVNVLLTHDKAFKRIKGIKVIDDI